MDFDVLRDYQYALFGLVKHKKWIRTNNGKMNNKKITNEFPTVGLKLTGACHLGCHFCCEPDRQQEIYPIDNFEKIVLFLKEKMGTRRICFTGGDPLLYPDIERILRYTKKLGVYVLLLTSNGGLLINRRNSVFPYTDAIRFSIHGIGHNHDQAVGCDGAFSDIERAIYETKKAGIRSMVTTVVTNETIDHLKDIASWIHKRGVSHLYLFGLMKSGKGGKYIASHGEPSFEAIMKIQNELKIQYEGKMDIIFYDYQDKAECILVYGDGRIIIDPGPNGINFQQNIGNVLLDCTEKIFEKFNTDPGNIVGYSKHFGNL